MGMDFFIPFPFPNFRNAFFHSLPVPELWEWIFSFPSRSRIVGMDFVQMFKSEWLERQDILLSFVANSFAAKVLVIVN